MSHDAPILLTVVDSEDKLRSLFPVLDQMVLQGLVVLSDVDIIKYSHAQPLTAPQHANRERPPRQPKTARSPATPGRADDPGPEAQK